MMSRDHKGSGGAKRKKKSDAPTLTKRAKSAAKWLARDKETERIDREMRFGRGSGVLQGT